MDARLRAAHASDDKATLVALYTEAAERSTDDATAFYLTQAYIFALDTGHPAAPALHARLIEMRRDH